MYITSSRLNGLSDKKKLVNHPICYVSGVVLRLPRSSQRLVCSEYGKNLLCWDFTLYLH